MEAINPEITLAPVQAAIEEIELAQPKPLTIGRLALGVCLGILLAAAVSGLAYYLTVESPRERAAQVEASREIGELDMQQQLRNDELDLENAHIEAKIKALQPGSPCNIFDGSLFGQCNELKTISAKRRFAAAHPIAKGAMPPA